MAHIQNNKMYNKELLTLYEELEEKNRGIMVKISENVTLQNNIEEQRRDLKLGSQFLEDGLQGLEDGKRYLEESKRTFDQEKADFEEEKNGF